MVEMQVYFIIILESKTFYRDILINNNHVGYKR